MRAVAHGGVYDPKTWSQDSCCTSQRKLIRTRGELCALVAQADERALDYEAAKQCHQREEHLRVPRKHVERIVGQDEEERELRLAAWIGNRRSRAATPAPERVEQLSAIGMRWT
ncbi:helicase associated domain-containing protein [Streptomyces sp. MMG1121]|uniref:helicase associated domain-containing protein n=1 Tax=Streptomyces sp. MMG1121 TaxID=1415544 RepID=UPI003B640A8B